MKSNAKRGANDIPNPRHLQGTKLKANLEDSTDSMPGFAHDDFTETYRPLLVSRLRKIHDIVLEGVELAPRKRKGRW